MDEKEFLYNYNPEKYQRQSVTVDIAVFAVAVENSANYRKLNERRLKILLVRRGGHPFKGFWALPGGFVGERGIDEAVREELKSETNVESKHMEQLHTWGGKDRDSRMRVISVSYLALINKNAVEIIAGDDAHDAAWFDIETLSGGVTEFRLTGGGETLEAEVTEAQGCDNDGYDIVNSGGLAFDHAKIIACALKRLRKEIWTSDIAFSLLPEEFTLTDLQKIYEMVLGHNLLAAAFRRKMQNRVSDTGKTTNPAGHRPAKLYRHAPDWRDRNE